MMRLGSVSIIVVLTCLVALQSCSNAPLQPDQTSAAPILLDKIASADFSRPSLNVSISIFDHQVLGVTPQRARLLSAEQRYLPYLLKEILVESGFWGGVRVSPRRDPTAELNCGGTLHQASAWSIDLHVICRDAIGQVWMDERLIEQVDVSRYLLDETEQDPYSPLMIRIANHLSQKLALATDQARWQIELAAILRYADALAPDQFSRFLQTDESGLLELVGLPAESDPMYARVLRIRDSEYQFIDAIDEQIGTIYTEMKVPYALWRRYQFEFEGYNISLSEKQPSKLRRVASDYGALLGTYKRYQDFKRNEDEIEEMGISLQRTLSPTVGRVEGQVLELTGSLDQQYELWRSFLMQIYRVESGVTVMPDRD